MAGMIMLSIITINYRSSRDISQCLESITKYEPNYKDYEFIIVDNNSDDPGLEKLAKDYPFVKIVYSSVNGGFAHGNNIGIKQASGDTLFLLNPDTYLKDNAIEKLYSRIKDDPDVDIIGPYLTFTDGSNQSSGLPKSYLTVWKLFCEQFCLYWAFRRSKIFNSYYRSYMDYEQECFVEQVHGSAMMFKRKLLEQIGYLDEEYFMYYEESDFCLQALKNGSKLLYYPGSTIIHIGGFMSESFWEKGGGYMVDSLKYYFRKNFSFASYASAMGIYFFGTLLRLIGLKIKNHTKHIYYFYQLKSLFSNKTGRSPAKRA
ncbi:MAG: glycosyltransferase family 2 protein [bacterium]|nr:glycosyltransferase family 2 protein [bacterium]